VRNPIPPTIAGRRFWPSGLYHVFCADIVGRNAMAGLMPQPRHPLLPVLRCPGVAKGTPIRLHLLRLRTCCHGLA